MRIQFLGATQTVTGSKYLLTIKEKNILVDCGLFQGLKELRLRNRSPLAINPSKIDAVILTHAHIDHTGYLPLLVKNGFSGNIYCTKSTQELCEILLPDCGHLQEEEANRANKYGYSKHKPALPLYTKADAEAVVKHFIEVPFHKDYLLFDDIVIHFNRAGHIIGAATLAVKCNDNSVLFSGDLGRPNDIVIYPPEAASAANYLVIESTYGDRLHEAVDVQQELAKIINTTANRGGTLVIPAFAVGRAQMLLYYIYALKVAKNIPNIPVFIDSPMARDVTAILIKHADEHRLNQQYCEAVCKVAKYINTVEESKLIDTYQYPKIIIAASGMATGGRVLHHLKVFAGDARNTILFSGYQAIGTRGEKMLNGAKKIKMLGGEVKVNAQVIALSNVSAHADYQEILTWLANNKFVPRKVFVTHGELHAATALKSKIEEKFGWNCMIPQYLQIEELV
jgi:metallo-beta-lactamase family protein